MPTPRGLHIARILEDLYVQCVSFIAVPSIGAATDVPAMSMR
jgi:hypothetical protein